MKRSDITEIARLYLASYLGKDEQPTQGLCAYFEKLYFSDPWRDLEASPSIVYADSEGDIRGFFGCFPRRFVYGDKTVSAVALSALMVHPSMRRRGVSRRITQAILDGPQTLTFTTTASPVSSNTMLRQCGFWCPPFTCLKWTKNLLLWNGKLSSVRGSGRLERLIRPLRMRRRRSSRSKQSGLHLIARQLQDPTELCVLRRQVLGKDVLVSDLDPPHVAWLWEIMADSHKPRRVCRCLLLSHHDQPVGWVVYCVHSDQHAKIVEFGCQPQHTEAVLSEFLEYAIEKGLHAVRGDCSTPELTLAVVSQGARLHFEPSGCVFHWKDQQIGTALTSGEAFWSELDGEGWISMQGR